ncbi:MAG: C40 family peptidase [Spirochaetales bacterium]|nr:C40 family peptidase [Spirochaetales bacterium]
MGKAGPVITSVQTKLQTKLLEGAEYVLGKNNMIVGGRHFEADCSGTVRAIYFYAGIDLAADFDRYTGNGVARLYKILRSKDLLYKTDIPQTGDIVFWDNTYDKNGDGKRNDPLTHVGMVVDVQKDGTIEYIHRDYLKGNVKAKMNLLKPDIFCEKNGDDLVILNTPIRMKKGTSYDGDHLSGQLFRVFGKGYLIE